MPSFLFKKEWVFVIIKVEVVNMKKVNKRIISSFLFLMVLLLIGCTNKSHYECEYKYDGSIYSESYDYKNNYGYG